MKKINVKVTFFLSLIAVVLLTAGILCGREVWLYEHPEIRITFSCDKRENIYRSYPFCVIRGRSHIGQGYAVRYDEEIQQFRDATGEVFQWINEKYDSPLSVSSDVTIGEGKTVITFWGTGKSIETGEMEEINRDCVLEYELDAEVLHLEETPELVENVWDPKEKGQQGQAETIYDPEAGVTATLRDISNVGANLIIRREDDDDGAEVIYGEAYILQRQVDGEWQDAETVPDNYGFPMVGYNVPGGEEASIYYNWEWLYGALEPGEYRMVWDVSRKDSGSASAQTYREHIRFRL
jgi:hypothetical protein